MKKIDSIGIVSNIDNNKFARELLNKVNEIQEKGFDLEIKYSTSVSPAGELIYGALIVGRIGEEIDENEKRN